MAERLLLFLGLGLAVTGSGGCFKAPPLNDTGGGDAPVMNGRAYWRGAGGNDAGGGGAPLDTADTASTEGVIDTGGGITDTGEPTEDTAADTGASDPDDTGFCSSTWGTLTWTDPAAFGMGEYAVLEATSVARYYFPFEADADICDAGCSFEWGAAWVCVENGGHFCDDGGEYFVELPFRAAPGEAYFLWLPLQPPEGTPVGTVGTCWFETSAMGVIVAEVFVTPT